MNTAVMFLSCKMARLTYAAYKRIVSTFAEHAAQTETRRAGFFKLLSETDT